MTYTTIRCPVCHSIVQRRRNATLSIGDPFQLCPYCNNTYVDPFIREWETLSPFRRFFYFFSTRSTSLAILVGLIFAGMIGNAVGGILTVVMIFLLPAFCVTIAWFIRRAIFKDAIKQSIQRTRNPEYLEKLKAAQLKIYRVKDK